MTTRKLPLIELIATCVQARLNCQKTGNTEWELKHGETANQCMDLLPSGSGFDNGTTIDLDASGPDKIVLHTSFHHMDDGFYSGWTEHTVTVRPSFIGRFDLRISGRDRNDIKEYIAQAFDAALSSMVEWSADGVRYISEAA